MKLNLPDCNSCKFHIPYVENKSPVKINRSVLLCAMLLKDKTWAIVIHIHIAVVPDLDLPVVSIFHHLVVSSHMVL